MTPAMVNDLLGVMSGVSVAVGSAAGTVVAVGIGSVFSITNTAVVRPGTVKVLFAYDDCFTTSSAEFC